MREAGPKDNRSRDDIGRRFPFDRLFGVFEEGNTHQPPWLVSAFPLPQESPRLVDLRPRPEFERAHIPGSCHLGTDEIDLTYLLPPRQRLLILISNSVEEAEDAALRLHISRYTAQAADAPLSRWPGPWKSGPETLPVWEPSPLVAAWVNRLPDGPVLDIACGSGRDAVFMAMHGANVTGIDLLPDALEQAGRLAARHGVALRLLQGDIENDPDCWEGRWSTINIQRFLHRGAFPLVRNRLRAGGILLCETFLEQQALAKRKPRKPTHLLKTGELYAASAGLSVLTYHEGLNSNGDWIASLVARKGDNRVEP